MKNLEELRNEISVADDEILWLYNKRLRACAEVAEYKKAENIPVFCPEREKQVLKKAVAEAGDEGEELYKTILGVSKNLQRDCIGKYYLLGGRLSHSLSPLLHTYFADYSYKIHELKEEELTRFFSDGNFDGLNITIPYKQTVMKYIDFISDEAKEIGSVNTVVKREGKLFGYTTDTYGFEYLLDKNGISVSGKKCIILGSGGSCRAVKYVLEKKCAGNITVISRNGENNYSNLSQNYDAEIIINTTPVGMYPNCPAMLIPLEKFEAAEAVIDLIYNPNETSLLCEARKKGLKAVNGLEMLVAQGYKSCKIFGFSPRNEIDYTVKQIKKQFLNISFIGMPSCGKTTVGRIVAEKLGRNFFDSDDFICELTSIKTDEYIEKFGEEKFRETESLAVNYLSKKSSCVIAYGGGATLKDENAERIRQNSVVVFLDRSPDKLITDGRPLSKKYGTEKLYSERYERYKSAADITVGADGDAEAVADAVIERIEKYFE